MIVQKMIWSILVFIWFERKCAAELSKSQRYLDCELCKGGCWYRGSRDSNIQWSMTVVIVEIIKHRRGNIQIVLPHHDRIKVAARGETDMG